MNERTVRSELNARVWTIDVRVGDRVGADDTLLVLESMKTEIPVTAPGSGTVLNILVGTGDMVAEGQPLMTLGA